MKAPRSEVEAALRRAVEALETIAPYIHCMGTTEATRANLVVIGQNAVDAGRSALRKDPVVRQARRPMSAKAQAYDREFRKASEEVKARSAGRCEAAVVNPSGPCLVWGYEVHHKRRRSQGGANDLGNLIYVCIPCHRWIHDHPADAAALELLMMGKSGR